MNGEQGKYYLTIHIKDIGKRFKGGIEFSPYKSRWGLLSWKTREAHPMKVSQAFSHHEFQSQRVRTTMVKKVLVKTKGLRDKPKFILYYQGIQTWKPSRKRLPGRKNKQPQWRCLGVERESSLLLEVRFGVIHPSARNGGEKLRSSAVRSMSEKIDLLTCQKPNFETPIISEKNQISRVGENFQIFRLPLESCMATT